MVWLSANSEPLNGVGKCKLASLQWEVKWELWSPQCGWLNGNLEALNGVVKWELGSPQ